MGRPGRIVVLAGGSPHAHDFTAVGRALADVLGDRADRRPVVVESPDEAVDALGGSRIDGSRIDGSPVRGPADVLVVDGLWWRMLGGAYDRWRPEHGYSPPSGVRSALEEFVSGGGGLVALHTAVICFDDWPGWGSMLGGAWRWGSSSHPPLGPVVARIAGSHPVVDGLGPELRLVDEVYGGLDVSPAVEVLAVARRTPGDDDQPVVWTHRHGDGRVVFSGFGHDAASILDPANARLINQAVAWAARLA